MRRHLPTSSMRPRLALSVACARAARTRTQATETPRAALAPYRVGHGPPASGAPPRSESGGVPVAPSQYSAESEVRSGPLWEDPAIRRVAPSVLSSRCTSQPSVAATRSARRRVDRPKRSNCSAHPDRPEGLELALRRTSRRQRSDRSAQPSCRDEAFSGGARGANAAFVP